jgi:hypothetical protein
MVYTRSGLSTNPCVENQSSIDLLYTMSLMSALYNDDKIVLDVYQNFIKQSKQSRNKILKELQEQYDLLQLAKTIF